MNLDLLKDAYESNSTVKAICDHMSSRPKNWNETAVHRIMLYLEKDGFDFKRSEVIAAFRQLENSGCGKYVEGRHGWKSRFVWLVKSKHIVGTVEGVESQTYLVEEDDESIDEEMIEHSYVLRQDMIISIELPADLSRNEAQRLSQFIDSLSFEEY